MYLTSMASSPILSMFCHGMYMVFFPPVKLKYLVDFGITILKIRPVFMSISMSVMHPNLFPLQMFITSFSLSLLNLVLIALKQNAYKSAAAFVDYSLQRFRKLVSCIIGHMSKLRCQSFFDKLIKSFSKHICFPKPCGVFFKFF